MKFTCSVTIDQPIETVARLFADPENLKAYQEGFVRKELLEGIAEWNSGGLVVTTGLGYAMVADAYIRANRAEDALKYADIGIVHMEGCEEKHYHSELVRYKALYSKAKVRSCMSPREVESILNTGGSEADLFFEDPLDTFTDFDPNIDIWA